MAVRCLRVSVLLCELLSTHILLLSNRIDLAPIRTYNNPPFTNSDVVGLTVLQYILICSVVTLEDVAGGEGGRWRTYVE